MSTTDVTDEGVRYPVTMVWRADIETIGFEGIEDFVTEMLQQPEVVHIERLVAQE